jgi:putative ABC transport system permease protein
MTERRHRHRRLWYLRRRPETVAAEVDEELGLHLELRVDALVAGGLSPEAAREEALRQFGDLEQTRAYCREQDRAKENHVQTGLMLDDLRQDLRIAARSLLRAPLLAATIVATVGLGIGATTVIFAGVHAALLRPLPYSDPARLVRIYTDTPPFKFRFSVADYLALEAQQTSFEQIAHYTDRAMTFSSGSVADVVRGRLVSWTYFTLLGIRPVLGPGFAEADGRPGRPPAVMVSDAFWRERLGGRTDVLGSSIRLDGTDHTLVGVLPRVMGPLERSQEFFIAAQFEPPPRRGPFFYTAIARLRPDVGWSAAADELRAINRRIFPIWQSSYQDQKATWSMMTLHEHIVGDVGTIAGLALAAVALVWLIACANASNLLVTRVTSRRRELAVRAALGASRGRVVRYLLTESALLAIGAAIIGAGIARSGVALLQSAGPNYFPRMQEIALSGPALWWLLGVTSASVFLFGLVPAVHGTGGPVDESLRSGRSATGGLGVRRLRRVLVGTQFAIATPLLVVAGLLLVSLNALRGVDLGFDTRNMVSASVRLPAAQYREPGPIFTFWSELERRLAALPGVAGVAFADGRPPNGVGNRNNFDLEDRPTPPGQSQPVTPWVAISPDYVRVLGLRLLQGRLLEARDAETEFLESVVVDRAWANRFFPDGQVVGKRFREGGCTQCPWTTVVGVVSEVKYVGLDKPDEGTVYAPLSRRSLARFLIVRTSSEARAAIAAVRQVLRELDPSVPLTSVATIDDLVDTSLERPRSLSLLVAAFAIAALVLSIVGIYGVMTYYVQQHARDISIRLALGGSEGSVLGLILGQGMKVVAGGVVIGVVAALMMTRLMSSLLFGVGAADASTYALVSALLLTVALLACAVPALRAVRLQPAVVLRQE